MVVNLARVKARRVPPTPELLAEQKARRRISTPMLLVFALVVLLAALVVFRVAMTFRH